jgi:hypothetical protein
MQKLFFSLLTFISLTSLNAQLDMAFYCDVMVNAFEGKNRVEAEKIFNKMFLEDLAKKESYDKAYADLKWISIKTDLEKTFKIFTWQVKDEKNIYLTKGVIQTQNGKLFELKDNVATYSKEYEYEAMDASNWYGALYYNIMETTTANGKAYLLFGYDGYDDKNRVKVIDVLSFENDKPIFGSEIFKINDGPRPDLKSRIVVEFSGLANVNCNYSDGMEMIVHDFVVTRAGVSTDGSPAKIPDGTYVGYKWDGKYWNFIPQIAHQISEQGDIFYQPKKNDGPKRDVIGRIKN